MPQADSFPVVLLDSLVALFDNRLYPSDTMAFGTVSDIDHNDVTAMIMTPVLNRMVTAAECESRGFVVGFFYGADLDPLASIDPRFSRGEVIYAIAPDSAGVYSCAHDLAQVRTLLPIILPHELQHAISFRYKVLSGGARAEELWLNEGLSHYAEELAGRTYLPDSATFRTYVGFDLFNAYEYLNRPDLSYLLFERGSGRAAERGSAWLFVRFLVDQLAADTSLAAANAVTRSLVQSAQTGAAVVTTHAAGEPFERTVARWALANWLTDLPGTSTAAPPELRYHSWGFRWSFEGLHQRHPEVFAKPYPLTPDSTPGGAVLLQGNLYSGSGMYHRVLHAPGASRFSLQLSDGAGGPVPFRMAARLAVVRVR
jgi:hypothetical protein